MISSKAHKSVLYVRLPCWKIYPGGLVSIADYVHKHSPGVRQRIIELSLVPPAKRRTYLKEAIRSFNPEVIAFSWRNIQTFAPHDGTQALEAVLNFEHSGIITDKVRAAYTAGRLILDYVRQLHQNKSYIHLAGKVSPGARLVVGGTAFSCYPEQLMRQLPEGTIGVVGEGERAILAIIEGRPLDTESVVYSEDGKVTRHQSRDYVNMEDFTPTDFEYITKIFPEFHSFIGDDVGVQTRRGCPFSCAFCIYNVIEGKDERIRKPSVVAEDVITLNRKYGVKNIWFSDSQFISTRGSLAGVEEILDRLIAAKTGISWTGYVRIENIDRTLAKKLLVSGIKSFDLTFVGSQKIIDNLELRYSLAQQMEAFKTIKDAGLTDQLIKLYLPLNSPGETAETLLETISTCRTLYGIFGKEKVYPWLFFLAIQAGTKLEKRLMDSGYLYDNYNPLSYNPFTIKKLLYNPPPLGKMIGRSFIKAKGQASREETGKVTLDLIEDDLSKGLSTCH
jgi:radical SAM superfamily enzyme YgiQ (UPF0313 family)